MMKKKLGIAFLVLAMVLCCFMPCSLGGFTVYADEQTEAVFYYEHDDVETQKTAEVQGTSSAADKIILRYRAYVQKKKWMSWQIAGIGNKAADTDFAGTTDDLRMETIQMQLKGVGGQVKYRAYVQKKGWTQWATTADTTTYAGTKGESRRIEMIQLSASGEVAKLCDVYYRTYCEKFGWLGWASANSKEKAGSSGYARKLEAFQIQLVPKGVPFDRGSAKRFYDKTKDGENPEPTIDQQVEQMVSNMSTREKLAQMMIVALRPYSGGSGPVTKLSDDYKETLKKYDFGGVILFGGNISDTEQTVTLIHDCQETSMNSEKGIPMLVCVDQEGGLVNRVEFGTTSSGSMGLAATGDTELTKESADILGQEIKALGFNMDFAPVSDVNNNPSNPIIGTRAFSDDPETVAEHVKAFIAGLEKNGVSSALKHFPGHGNVGEDSHTHLPLSELSLDELKSCELIPFKAGIESGVDMIMTAHIQYPNIEKNTYVSKKDGEKVYLPATLSREVITGVLREELGYNGIVITDAMDMDAIAAHFDDIDAAVLAINADVDIILMPVNLYKDATIDTLTYMDTYMDKLIARVEAGDIKEEEINDSVSRILKLKLEKGIMTEKLPALDEQIAEAEAVVGSAEHHIREWQIAQKGITLLKNEGGILPIKQEEAAGTLILISNEYRQPAVEYALDRVKREGVFDTEAVRFMCYTGRSMEDEELTTAIDSADRVLIISQSASKQKLLTEVIERVHRREGAKVALLSVGLPYDAACYEDADAVMCAYNQYGDAHDEFGNGPFNMNVAVCVCTAFGQSVPQGILPVNIPRVADTSDGGIEYLEEVLYERGYGLKEWGE
ncbi:MAG: hypothetical protein IKO61_07630 [Lachnospiraceae bacterium]|nr:hypothetical protein [Lachnospiraceae bacterium]